MKPQLQFMFERSAELDAQIARALSSAEFGEGAHSGRYTSGAVAPAQALAAFQSSFIEWGQMLLEELVGRAL